MLGAIQVIFHVLAHLIFNVVIFIVFFYYLENGSTERLNNLLKATQIISGRL